MLSLSHLITTVAMPMKQQTNWRNLSLTLNNFSWLVIILPFLYPLVGEEGQGLWGVFYKICTDCFFNCKHRRLQAALRTDSELMKKRKLNKETRVVHQYDLQHETKKEKKKNHSDCLCIINWIEDSTFPLTLRAPNESSWATYHEVGWHLISFQVICFSLQSFLCCFAWK